jgi:hypothetical protein
VLLGGDHHERAAVQLAFLLLRTATALIERGNASVPPCTAVPHSTEKHADTPYERNDRNRRVRLGCSALSFAPPAGRSTGQPDFDRCDD